MSIGKRAEVMNKKKNNFANLIYEGKRRWNNFWKGRDTMQSTESGLFAIQDRTKEMEYQKNNEKYRMVMIYITVFCLFFADRFSAQFTKCNER